LPRLLIWEARPREPIHVADSRPAPQLLCVDYSPQFLKRLVVGDPTESAKNSVWERDTLVARRVCISHAAPYLVPCGAGAFYLAGQGPRQLAQRRRSPHRGRCGMPFSSPCWLPA
jgi:hypothetical protein